MEIKKDWKKNLENYRSLFFLGGIALSLITTTEILQLQSEVSIPEKPKQEKDEVSSALAIPITIREKPEIPEPTKNEPEPDPILEPTDKWKLVDDNTKLETFTIEPNSALDTIEYVPIQGFDVPEPIEAVNVENMARPKDCEELRGKEAQMNCFNQWISQYIANEVEFPNLPSFRAQSEKIFVEFVIGADGNVSDVAIIRGQTQEYRDEAKRVIESLPELVPASQLGRKVPVRVRVPVNFKIR